MPPMTAASAHGLTTMDLVSGRTLDAWYPAPALAAEPHAGRGPARRGAGRRAARRPHRAGHDGPRRPRRAAHRPRRRLPAPAPALPPPRPPARHQHGRHLRRARQRGVDEPRPRRPRPARPRPPALPRRGPPPRRLRRRQVPPHDRLRRAGGRARSPTPTASASAPTSREGTTVMHEGFVNYNAGTLGRVDGRGPHQRRASSSATARTSAAAPRSWARSAAAGQEVISIGERCLLGANAGIGISLGDDSIVEAGLYLTAGTRVTLPDGAVVEGAARSAARRTCSSAATASPASSRRYQRHGTWGGLNETLHSGR